MVDQVVDIFQLVYGRLPNADERDSLTKISETAQKDCRTPVFRAIVSRYDHQVLPTPFTVRFSSQDIEYIPVQGFELAVDKADVSVSWPLRQGIYEPHLIRFFRERLEAGMVFVDVGANIGLYSMLAAQAVGKNGKVFSFEPNSENCRLIMLSAHRNEYENVMVFPFALSNQVGHALFSSHIGSNGGIIPDTQDSLLNPSCFVVPVARLEDMITDKVDVIKMDVEGAEGLVIQGARHLIERDRPIVTSEFSLEMLPRVSKISGKDYLHYFVKNHYAIYLIDQNRQELVSIDDVDTFVEHYGRPERIEDLVFIPQ